MEFQIPSDNFQLQVDQRQSLRGRRGQGRSEISPTLEGFRCHIAHSCVVKTSSSRGFPGGQVVKTLCFHCRGASLISGWGIKIPHNRLKKKKNELHPTFHHIRLLSERCLSFGTSSFKDYTYQAAYCPKHPPKR